MSELTFTLNEWSEEFFLSERQKICLTGEFGSGKTSVAGLTFDKLLNAYPGTTGVVLRNLSSELDTATIPQYFELIWGNRYRPPYPIYYHSTKKHVRYPNGSEIWFFAMDDEKALRKLKNIVIGLLWVEQAEEIDQWVWTMADGRVRQKNAPLKRILTANPEGGGHFLKELFYVQPLEIKQHKIEDSPCHKANGKSVPYGYWRGKDSDYLGIVAKPKANAGNLPKGYYKNLESNFPYIRVMKYVYASWFGKSGLIYDLTDAFLDGVPWAVDQIPFPAERLEGGDYGISDTSPMVWLTVIFQDGIYYVMSEFYQYDSSIGNLAEYIKNNEGYHIKEESQPLKSNWRIGCPRTFQREGGSIGMSKIAEKLTPADLLAKQKIKLIQYPVHVTTRQTICATLFETGRVKVVNCPELNNELSKYKWSSVNASKAKQSPAHAIEALERILTKHYLYNRNKGKKKIGNTKTEIRETLADGNYMTTNF